MRPNIRLLVFSVIPLLAPLPASALEVTFCIPNCEAPTAIQTRSSSLQQTVRDATTGVTTTTFPIPTDVVLPGFTISGTVTAQQSGTLQKITFNPTAITATGACNTTLNNPCRLQIVATSQEQDFPDRKPVGGYPSGVYMAGVFTGVEPLHKFPADPNGDTISMTGEASGLSEDGEPINNAVINATPGTSVGDTATSLPSACSGNPSCKFIATSGIRSFNTKMEETVQQVCAVEMSDCRTRLRTSMKVEIKRSGNRVNLPGGMVTVTPPAQGEPQRNLLSTLQAETLPPLGSMMVQRLLVGSRDFALTAQFKLGQGASIDPVAEEVYLKVGDFTMTVLPRKFKRLLSGKLYTFLGKIDGRDVAATFLRDNTDSTRWTFAVGVHGIDLRSLLTTLPGEVPVDIAVGTDTGSDLVAARIF